MESRPVGDLFLPGEEGRLDFVSVHEEISTCDEDHAIKSKYSESGWTMYLDHSLDSLRISNSLTGFEEEADEDNKLNVDNSPSNKIAVRSWDVVAYEDSASMASDASSGPQLRDVHHDPDLPQKGRIFNPGTTKRRRVEACDHLHRPREDPSLLEDTASSPVHRPKSEVTAGEANAKKKNSRPSECVSELEAEAVNRRLDLLQSLLPDGAKVSREEALGVAIEYIVGLEQRIKRLEAEGAEGNTDYRRDHGPKSGSGALFRRGLCLIPVSMAGDTSHVEI